MTTHEYDYIVIGSGFGGSVSALRLAQKGYRVLVVERGRRFGTSDFARRNWNFRKFLWAPKLFCYGIQAITFLRDAMILHGSGVGGGSLVYANVLLVPPDEVFDNPHWRRFRDWKAALAPHYATAQRMLGATEARGLGTTDHMLREIAEELGRGDTFHTTEVGIFFGESGKTVPDPYFEGDGPDRTGCTFCGGCMTGCREGAKNTLDKNYLYLAEKLGVTIVPEHEVEDVRELEGGGYEVCGRRITGFVFHPRRRWTARGVVFAGGVLGTVPLLFKCQARGSLSRLSPALGTYVRTNSEALVGARALARDADFSKGIAIASGINPDDDTHIEMVRYAAGQDAMGTLTTPMVGGGPPWPRWLRWLGGTLLRPWRFVHNLLPVGWARQTAILLVMQPLENYMAFRWRRRWWWPFSRGLSSQWESDARVPKYFPVAHDVAERLAVKMGGRPVSALPEALFSLSSTAHILGGCPMGASPEQGVIDTEGRVHGYDNMHIADGSIVPVNLSVNPSLTITALAEFFMSQVPERTDSDQ